MSESTVMLTGDHTSQGNCSCKECIQYKGLGLDHAPVQGGCDYETTCECETVLLGGLEFYKPSPDNGIELSGAVVITRIHVDADGCEISDDGAGWE